MIQYASAAPGESASRAEGPAHRPVAVAVIAVIAALVVGAMGAGMAQAAGPDPVAPEKPPALVEGFSPYLPQVSCDPVAKAGTLALRSMLLATYGGRDLGITRGCDVGATSEHKEGRAWDWGLNASVPAEKAVADQFLTWLLAPGPNGMPALQRPPARRHVRDLQRPDLELLPGR